MQKIALASVICIAAGCAPLTPVPRQASLPPQPIETRVLAAPAGLAPEASTPAEPDAALAPQTLLRATRELGAPAPPIEAAPPPATLWKRISTGFVMSAVDNDEVREWENWYAQRPDYVARMIERSSRFLFHVVEEVEKRHMPTEIALLPMVESAYNPTAYSRAHASGMWQFIPSTGKVYGLRQNWWYDGRRDVIDATEAALDYLQKLHGLFGDWQLALAAYNCGEGAVSRAIERNRARGLPTDYESLGLPAETREYVPKLIAVKNIISDPARFGLNIEDIPNEPYFDTVEVEHHIDVQLAARLAEVEVEEFRFLNPGHKKPVIKAGEADSIVLPKDKVPVFRANVRKHVKPFVSWKFVTLRRGQKPQRLAATHGMTLAELRRVNDVRGRKRIRPGQRLLVRVEAGVTDPHLPELEIRPVSLPRAVKAAKAKAGARKAVKVRRAVARGGRSVRVRSAKSTGVKKPVRSVKKSARKSRQRASRR
ncbi:MAG TPA: transglycosylase SLT domain-containing protein [Burkholderiales bacterium]|nr:transglycosylase SLT domain-containing protein [Burkholderiales bacterium]